MGLTRVFSESLAENMEQMDCSSCRIIFKVLVRKLRSCQYMHVDGSRLFFLSAPHRVGS